MGLSEVGSDAVHGVEVEGKVVDGVQDGAQGLLGCV